MNAQKYNIHPSFRPGQEECINQLVDASDTGVAELSAPTGAGKSILLYVTGKLLLDKGFEKVIYTSPQISLVDQLERDNMPGTVTLKGQSNYKCDVIEGLDVSVCPKRAMEGRAFYPCPECTYYHLKSAFQNTDFGIATLDLVLTNKKLADADVLIVDESQQWEPALLRHYEVNLPLDIDEQNIIPGLQAWSKSLDQDYSSLQEEQLELYPSMRKRPISRTTMDSWQKLYRKITRMENSIKKVDEIKGLINAGWPWLISDTKDDYGKEHKTFKLVTGARLFAQMQEKYEYIILASGTPTTSVMTNDFTRVSMPAPIPVEDRRVIFDPVGKMSMKYKEATLPKMANKIVELHNASKQCTLVHCHTYDIANNLYARIRRKVPVICQTKETRKDKVALEEWKKMDEGVFLSVNYTEGIDLWQEKFNLNLIAKVPYPNLGDAWMVKRNEYDEKKHGFKLWYTLCTIVNVQQASGRTSRGKYPSTTRILDSSFGGLYRQNARLFEPYFCDALIMK
jgi:Rad3-related DNA helicase